MNYVRFFAGPRLHIVTAVIRRRPIFAATRGNR